MRPTLRSAALAMLALVILRAGNHAPPATVRTAMQYQQGDARRTFIRGHAVVVHILQQVRALSDSGTQAELSLTPGQVTAAQAMPREAAAAFADFVTAAEPQRSVQLKGRWLPEARRLDARIRALVSPAQHARLVEITLGNQIGAIVLLTPEVEERLRLDAAQEQRIEQLAEELITACQRNGTGIVGRLRSAQRARTGFAEALGLLRPAQRAAWEACLGAETAAGSR